MGGLTGCAIVGAVIGVGCAIVGAVEAIAGGIDGGMDATGFTGANGFGGDTGTGWGNPVDIELG